MAVFPEPPNTTGMVEIAAYANTVTSGLFWSIMVLALYMIILLRLNGVTNGKNAVAGAGFTTTILAGLLWFIGLISTYTMSLLFIVMVASSIYLYLKEEIVF